MELEHPAFPDDGPVNSAIKAALVAVELRLAADEWGAMASANLRDVVEAE